MTKQEILHLYGESVYQIRLSVAKSLYVAGGEAEDALQKADRFVAELQLEDHQKVVARYE